MDLPYTMCFGDWGLVGLVCIYGGRGSIGCCLLCIDCICGMTRRVVRERESTWCWYACTMFPQVGEKLSMSVCHGGRCSLLSPSLNFSTTRLHERCCCRCCSTAAAVHVCSWRLKYPGEGSACCAYNGRRAFGVVHESSTNGKFCVCVSCVFHSISVFPFMLC